VQHCARYHHDRSGPGRRRTLHITAIGRLRPDDRTKVHVERRITGALLDRLFSEAAPAARKLSRQPLSADAVTPISRLTSSRSSPRSTRSTASCFLRADMRR